MTSPERVRSHHGHGERKLGDAHRERLGRLVKASTAYKAAIVLRSSVFTVETALTGGLLREHTLTRLELAIETYAKESA